MSPAGELDDPFIARYAERVDDEVEVLWRADFARMVDMRERAFDEDASLLPTADEIEAYWMSDPQVDPHWCALREIHSAWVHAPEAMRKAHEMTMPGGVRPPGMDQPRWASHMQAREMTGHGYWPGHEPTHSTSSPERHEPMTNTTPAHVLDSATESDIERQLRTDYELAILCTSSDPAEYDPADAIDYRSYASPWLDHEDPRYTQAWVNIGQAAELWRNDPDAAAARLADPATTALQRRDLEQGHDIARGIYTRDVHEIDYVTDPAEATPQSADSARPNYWHGLDQEQTSRDSARNCPDNPVPSFGVTVAARTRAVNAFRNTKSVNAFAAVAAERERDGMER